MVATNNILLRKPACSFLSVDFQKLVSATAATWLFAVGLNVSATNLPADVNSAFPGKIATAEKPIRDKQGRIRYIVDVVDEPVKLSNLVKTKVDFIAYKRSESNRAMAKLLKDNAESVEVLATTRGSGTSFFAYMTVAQAQKLAKDERVRLVTEDHALQPSNWQNITLSSGDISSWGRQAMRAHLAPPAYYNANVYVIDTGVELHNDLVPNLSAANRVNAMDAIRAMNGLPSTNISPIGCWPHATHVAGIIGAREGGGGVIGMAPTATLHSYAATSTNYAWNGTAIASSPLSWPAAPCSGASESDGGYGGITLSGIVASMELVWLHVLQHGTGVVNMSFNGGNYQYAFGTVGYKIKEIATPVVIDAGWSTISYPGALVVQSAGNQGQDACEFVYYDPNVGHNVNNGVMVVGGLHFDNALTPVNPGDGTGPYYEPNVIPFFPAQGNGTTQSQPGTNYGQCVEVWAPSNKIISTWTNGTYQQLSGTSMAAPHIAGFAARILQNSPGLNSQQLEAAVRLKFRYLGMQPWGPQPMYMPDFGN